jgi:hypothetical protein
MDENLIIENHILKGYKESGIVTVDVPEGVVAISNNAFSDFPYLTNITLPKSLAIIGNGVFQNCPKLTEIDLTNIMTIGEKAFCGCTALHSVIFGEKIAYLANAVFLGCTTLTKITLPENIVYIGCECFKDCTTLTTIKIDGVMEIDNNAFENCSSLCNIMLPNSLTHISPNAFSFCEKLDTIIIHNRFIDIDEAAFENDVNFTINSTQNSAAQSYAKINRYKFRPTIVESDYRIITQEQLYILSKSDILLYAKQLDNGKDEILIHFDKSVTDKINTLIGGKQND